MAVLDDVQSVMKVQWYLQGYEVLLQNLCVYNCFYSHGYLRWLHLVAPTLSAYF